MADEVDQENIPPCFDCHAHIYADELSQDIDDVIKAAQKNGVAAVVGVTEFQSDFQKLLDLTSRYPDFVAPCLGIHPVQQLTPERSVTMDDLIGVEDIIRQNQHNLFAIGEIGLDFTPRFIKSDKDKDNQKEVFIQQIQLAMELDLPVNVHSRSAGRHVIQILRDQGAKRVNLHAFDGRASVALTGVEAGFFFSIPPSIVRSEQKQKLVKQVPLSNLLLETDSPALSPVKQTRNEPKNIVISCKEIARIKGVSMETVFQETTKNALKLFPKLAKFLPK
ncbi:putative deoxyribonuclease TATDN3 [Actinia tenebrosa]|uniref:Deoxyribonuclease TATDN3 n=1 Tax=Actinia tenebrosa TaxID=6105 RepID=A0A6P8ICK6_ACTTE|nr:putative deoxyribonuclease TATDN3 [Actinia tenebrosa]